jgi:single-strand DNA-binding protein
MLESNRAKEHGMSAANINRVTITGNLTKDPDLRAVGESGIEVCEMRVAVNARRKKGDEWIDVPNYFDVVVWGKRGKLCDDFLAKGSGVAVDGRLEWREWKGQDEKNHQAIQIVADNIQFIGPRRERAAAKEGEGSQSTESSGPSQSDVPADSSGFEQGVPAGVGATSSSDDDIPF